MNYTETHYVTPREGMYGSEKGEMGEEKIKGEMKRERERKNIKRERNYQNILSI
jgi:hypothetical protein